MTPGKKGESFKIEEPLFKSRMLDLNSQEEICSSIRLKIISGGMDDNVHFGLAKSIRNTKFNNISIPGKGEDSLGYNSQNGILTLFVNGKKQIQLPRTGSGDTLEFWLTSHSNVIDYLIII